MREKSLPPCSADLAPPKRLREGEVYGRRMLRLRCYDESQMLSTTILHCTVFSFSLVFVLAKRNSGSAPSKAHVILNFSPVFYTYRHGKSIFSGCYPCLFSRPRGLRKRHKFTVRKDGNGAAHTQLRVSLSSITRVETWYAFFRQHKIFSLTIIFIKTLLSFE
jgi:hypothetical protein